VDLGDRRIFGFVKGTRDGREWVCVVLNLDRMAGVCVEVPPNIPPASPRSCTDPATGASHSLPDFGKLELGPSGVAVISSATPDRAAAAGAAGTVARPLARARAEQ
jgi:hypothetical protein